MFHNKWPEIINNNFSLPFAAAWMVCTSWVAMLHGRSHNKVLGSAFPCLTGKPSQLKTDSNSLLSPSSQESKLSRVWKGSTPERTQWYDYSNPASNECITLVCPHYTLCVTGSSKRVSSGLSNTQSPHIIHLTASLCAFYSHTGFCFDLYPAVQVSTAPMWHPQWFVWSLL